MTDERVYIILDREELEDLLENAAEKGASKSVQKLHNSIIMGVGKSVISKLVYIIGAVTVGAILWLNSHNFIKL